METSTPVCQDDVCYDIHPKVTKRILIQTMANSTIEANGTPQSVYLWGKRSFGGNIQLERAFQVLAAKFILTFCSEADDIDDMNDFCSHVAQRDYTNYKQILNTMVGKPAQMKQLVMFLARPAGCGKSTVTYQLIEYGRQFCFNINQPFTTKTILVTAYLGLTAASIGGETVYSAVFHSQLERSWESVKMLIVHDTCILSSSQIKALDTRLKWLLKNDSKCFGGLDVVFVGDILQLPPVGQLPFYRSNCHRLLSSVNSYINLDICNQFEQDDTFGQICQNLYNGCSTEHDISILNKRVLEPPNTLTDNVTSICTSFQEKEKINYYTWLQHLRHHGEQQGLLIIEDTTYFLSGQHPCCSSISGSHLKNTFVSVLHCYTRCPQMLTINVNLHTNLAKGTHGFFLDVVLKPDQEFHYKNIEGITVKSVYASQIEYVLWEVNGSLVKIHPQQNTYVKNKFPSTTIQVPLVSSNAIYASQLEGLSIQNLYISSWKYTYNWPYLVLSRVHSLKHFFLCNPFKLSRNCHMPTTLSTMLSNFERTAFPPEFDYECLD